MNIIEFPVEQKENKETISREQTAQVVSFSRKKAVQDLKDLNKRMEDWLDELCY